MPRYATSGLMNHFTALLNRYGLRPHGVENCGIVRRVLPSLLFQASETPHCDNSATSKPVYERNDLSAVTYWMQNPNEPG